MLRSPLAFKSLLPSGLQAGASGSRLLPDKAGGVRFSEGSVRISPSMRARGRGRRCQRRCQTQIAWCPAGHRSTPETRALHLVRGDSFTRVEALTRGHGREELVYRERCAARVHSSHVRAKDGHGDEGGYEPGEGNAFANALDRLASPEAACMHHPRDVDPLRVASYSQVASAAAEIVGQLLRTEVCRRAHIAVGVRFEMYARAVHPPWVQGARRGAAS